MDIKVMLELLSIIIYILLILQITGLSGDNMSGKMKYVAVALVAIVVVVAAAAIVMNGGDKETGDNLF